MDTKAMSSFQHQLLVLVIQILLICLSSGLVDASRLNLDDCAGMYRDCTSNPLRLSPTEMRTVDLLKSQCFCDNDCWKFGDCCSDAVSPGKKSLRWTCETNFTNLPTLNYPTYAIGHCPEDWTDESVNKQCNRNVSASNYHYLLDLPVYSKGKGRFYSNMFCAACHNDSELIPVSLKINSVYATNCSDIMKMNGTYQRGKLQWKRPSCLVELRVINYTNGDSPFQFDNGVDSVIPRRRCHITVDKCAPGWTDSPTAIKCKSFPQYVYVNTQMYKNEHCAKCNYENITSCRIRKGKHFLQRGPYLANIQLKKSYDLLLDFTFEPPPGRFAKCLYDEIYDPIMKKCILSPCGKNVERVKGNCIAIKKKSCPAYVVLTSDLHVFENRSIFVNQTQKIHNTDEYRRYNETVHLVCSEQEVDSHLIQIGGVNSGLSIACLAISLISLAAHIIIHCIIGQLDKLPIKNLLNLSVALFIAQLLFLIGVNRTEDFGVCFAIGVAIHFFFLAVFFWMNVMAFDICWTFTRERYRPNYVRRKRTFYFCLAYAWLIPLMIVICGVIADRTHMLPIVQPNYGIRLCWISNRFGLLIFFALPLAVLLLENILFFVTTAYWIWKTTRDCRNLKKPECSRFYLYLKLAFIMGLTWIFGFVAALTDFTPLWYGFIILNASQGTFVFVVFTLKRRIMRQLCEKLMGRTPAAFKRKSSGSQRTSVTRMSSIRATSPEQTNMLADEKATEIR